MGNYLGIKPLPFDPPKEEVAEVCGRPGHNIVTHCIEKPEHEGCHTYSPIPDAVELMSDKLEAVMRLMTTSCPDYTVGDFMTPRPTCCIYHNAAKTIIDAQAVLRVVGR